MRVQLAEMNSAAVGLRSEMDATKMEISSKLSKVKTTITSVHVGISELSQHVQGQKLALGAGKKRRLGSGALQVSYPTGNTVPVCVPLLLPFQLAPTIHQRRTVEAMSRLPNV